MPAEPQPTLLLGDVKGVSIRAAQTTDFPIECVIRGTDNASIILPISADVAKSWAALLVTVA